MNYNKYHRPNFCYLSSTAEGLKKGLWFFFYLKYCKTILSMTTHASWCILNTFWPIITKNVLLSTYFTTDLYHRMTHIWQHPPPAPVVVISKVIVSFLEAIWSTGGCLYSPFDADSSCSQLQWSDTEASGTDTLLGSISPKCQQDPGLP